MAIPNYDESSIRVLKGLEPVRQRPGMYTRTDHPLHILQEVIDNAADEALAGHANLLKVCLHTDGSISVEDNGRGIPVGEHPEEKSPVVELVFTRLHAGGKFDKKDGGAYAFSGGLHGVGVSVTNALSTRLEVEVKRDAATHLIVFSGGDVITPLHEVSKVGRRNTGTRVRVWPDATYFDSPAIPMGELIHVLRSKAVLLSGVTVQLTNEKTGDSREWCYQNGLRGYLEETLEQPDYIVPLFEGQQYAPADDDDYSEGEGAHWVVAWTADGAVVRESYVNLISTSAGGTHEAGLRDGLFNAVKSFAELHSLIPKGVRLLPEDVFARASFVLSAKILDPQFQGQIKERLNSRDAVRMISAFVRNALELTLHANVDTAKKLADYAIKHAQARARSAQRVEKRKSSGVAVLPGKLTDCESQDVTRTELFLVEGDSAGGSAKMGRDKSYQAILPLRGKVLNSWEVHKDRLFANQEIHDVSVAIGVDPHGPGDTVDLSGLRYGRICILSDADVDGSHIQVLLLTLFFKHFPRLIEEGNIFVARPPLFRLDVPAVGKRAARKIYCLDLAELEGAQDKLRSEGIKESQWSVSRFKGLGEMSAEQLWDTTMNPDTRRLLPVRYGDLGLKGTETIFDMLMGRGEAAQRRTWLEEKGNLADIDV
ncbi:type IIA DNA topoisomerase subunit B [Paenalcaligenes niemegkensis]|uniref:DNA topoisomerase IV subunit B n=1 Tax=Paenalcaligenes niemegkensis TaxID=2895469 RepID=UPI001EE9A0DA|nr:DNA topoisomerase IV subunit B [Paenalcaligenes niemegkensis]MCQ9616753.1 type IIA DNA topoisomerase subunit B [Paenalcaligenes niemegkensis]